MMAGSAGLACGHVQRVRSAGPVDSAALVRALRAIPQGSRIAELAQLADPATWEGSLAKELLGAESAPSRDDAAQSRSEVDAERVFIVNDALESVEHDLSGRASWPRAGRRLALLGTVLALVVAKFVGPTRRYFADPRLRRCERPGHREGRPDRQTRGLEETRGHRFADRGFGREGDRRGSFAGDSAAPLLEAARNLRVKHGFAGARGGSCSRPSLSANPEPGRPGLDPPRRAVYAARNFPGDRGTVPFASFALDRAGRKSRPPRACPYARRLFAMTQHQTGPSSRPGQMTAVMRAMSQASGPEVLRIGLVQGGKVIEERVIKQRSSVTIGPSEKSMFVIASKHIPANFKLFELSGQEYVLNFLDGMTGRVALRTGISDLAALRGRRSASSRATSRATRSPSAKRREARSSLARRHSSSSSSPRRRRSRNRSSPSRSNRASPVTSIGRRRSLPPSRSCFTSGRLDPSTPIGWIR